MGRTTDNAELSKYVEISRRVAANTQRALQPADPD